jgi:FAD/FMN-containing dehydrogenase/Fe-S oxidoreductase
VRPRQSAKSAELVEALRRRGVAEVDASRLARSLYSSDASLYRVEPLAVARPRHPDELIACLDAGRELGVPLTMRGAGTSIAGNAVGAGLVVDVARHLDAIYSIEPDARAARVQPGVVHQSLQRAAVAVGLRFGPDPSSHSRCTVGGMIGNDACGSRALSYGRTSENIAQLECVTGAGERLTIGPGSGADNPTLQRLHDVVAGGLATIRTEFGRFGRQSSGYALDRLLPERGFDIASALVGSEGTLAVVLAATVRLVETPRHRALAVLGYPTMADGADDAPAVTALRPTACEGLDHRLVDVVRARKGSAAAPDLPAGSGWLMVETVGETAAEAAASAGLIAEASSASAFRIVTGDAEQSALWRVREQGAGLAALALDRPGRAGWEDAAVPPARLGAYLRDFDRLLSEHGLDGVPYGHFGDGCVHVRIDFPIETPGGPRAFRAFLDDAAGLVASYGGSLSGEHGDGRARSELLASMYSAEALRLLAEVKAVFDPDNLLNPGVIVAPRRPEADLRLTARRSLARGIGIRLPDDGGDLTAAVHRCTGVGACVAPSGDAATVMCPSFTATRDEKDSTRGRARVLQDMVGGRLGGGVAWNAPEVRAALDLCLACKGCASDCPTGVDVATYKAEVLHQAYRRRLRPRSHYALGRLPQWVALAAHAPSLANTLLSFRPTQRLARTAAGIDRRRSLPSLAPESLSRRTRRRGIGQDDVRLASAVVWADTFTNYFAPEVGAAAAAVLVAAGHAVTFTPPDLCCGLTLYSTGQIEAGRRRLRRTIDGLAPLAAAGLVIVGLEPSCTAMLRGDAAQVIDDERLAQVAASVKTLAEVLAQSADWPAPDLRGRTVVAQPHCHHASVLGWEADNALLAATGADIRRVGGCCGLAGSFGMEDGHYDLSAAIAQRQLLPAVRAAGPSATVLADGFSCRTQLEQLGNTRALHLAELLAGDVVG